LVLRVEVHVTKTLSPKRHNITLDVRELINPFSPPHRALNHLTSKNIAIIHVADFYTRTKCHLQTSEVTASACMFALSAAQGEMQPQISLCKLHQVQGSMYAVNIGSAQAKTKVP
jgi:hypothetical protein